MQFISDIQSIFRIFLDEAIVLLPYFALSILFAAFVKTFKWDRRVRASVVSYPRASIVVATVAGIISPLCSCGVLPIVIALSGAGVPIPPVMALLITSPIMSPDSLIITAAEIGPMFAAGKLVIALITGLVTGYVCQTLVAKGLLPEFPFRKDRFDGEVAAGKKTYQDIVDAGCFEHARVGADTSPGTFPFFLTRAREMTVITGKFLLIALILQAGITYYVPSNIVESFFGSRNANSVLLAAIISVPLPLHQMIAPPVLKGLMGMGLSPGAAMAILTGGPVTSIPAMGLLAGLYQKRAFVTYMFIGVSVTIIAGLFFQLLVFI
jgi:uncharacterized membrane protein YraQ (UPF0718 family)